MLWVAGPVHRERLGLAHLCGRRRSLRQSGHPHSRDQTSSASRRGRSSGWI